MRELFLDVPARFQGCSGSRNISDNLSDLKAQIAANARGIALIQNLIDEYGLSTVQTYMYAIQTTAEQAVRILMKELYQRFGGRQLSAIDYMDDGTPIRLTITIDEKEGSAVFDFAGTGPEVHGNINAPEAITHSAIIYALRCMINADIPLNQGCLSPIDIRIPRPSILSPTRAAAVVGGNVTTSQRVTDVVLKALGACAASQGCLNNLTFGIDAKTDKATGALVPGFGYYETYVAHLSCCSLVRVAHLLTTSKHRRRRWRWPNMARRERRARAHDQHSHHGPRDPREAVPVHPAQVRAAGGHGWAWRLPGWRWRDARDRVLDAGAVFHPVGAARPPPVRHGGRRAGADGIKPLVEQGCLHRRGQDGQYGRQGERGHDYWRSRGHYDTWGWWLGCAGCIKWICLMSGYVRDRILV